MEILTISKEMQVIAEVLFFAKEKEDLPLNIRYREKLKMYFWKTRWLTEQPVEISISSNFSKLNYKAVDFDSQVF